MKLLGHEVWPSMNLPQIETDTRADAGGLQQADNAPRASALIHHAAWHKSTRVDPTPVHIMLVATPGSGEEISGLM